MNNLFNDIYQGYILFSVQRRPIMSILVIITYILDFPYLSQKFWITISPINHHLCFMMYLSLHVSLSLSLSIKQIKEYFIFWLTVLFDWFQCQHRKNSAKSTTKKRSRILHIHSANDDETQGWTGTGRGQKHLIASDSVTWHNSKQ